MKHHLKQFIACAAVLVAGFGVANRLWENNYAHAASSDYGLAGQNNTGAQSDLDKSEVTRRLKEITGLNVVWYNDHVPGSQGIFGLKVPQIADREEFVGPFVDIIRNKLRIPKNKLGIYADGMGLAHNPNDIYFKASELDSTMLSILAKAQADFLDLAKRFPASPESGLRPRGAGLGSGPTGK